MLRKFSVSFFALVLAAGVIRLAAGQSVETLLGESAVGGDTIRVIARDTGDGVCTLAISAGSETSRQSFNVQTACLPKLEKASPSGLRVEAVDPSDANNIVASFSTKNADGDSKWIGVWLNKNNGRWALRGEWSVDQFNHKELGEKDEKHAFAFDAGGILKRGVKRNNIEGVKTTCAAGCCVVWQSRTLVTEEIETLAWNPETRAAERKSYRRWYVTQHGDGILSIAQKMFGNPARMATILRLNPELQKQESLEDGQRVLIESEIK